MMQGRVDFPQLVGMRFLALGGLSAFLRNTYTTEHLHQSNAIVREDPDPQRQ